MFASSNNQLFFNCVEENTSIEITFLTANKEMAVSIKTATQSELFVEQSTGVATFTFDRTSFPLQIIDKTGQIWFVEKNCHIERIPQSD